MLTPPNRQQQNPQQNQQPSQPQFTPSPAFDRFQNWSNFFFLLSCSSGGILAVNLARSNPAYRWLVGLLAIAAIWLLAFFPNAGSEQIRRLGILAAAAGIAIGCWEFLAKFNFKFQLPQFVGIGIAIAIVLVVLAAIGSFSSSGGQQK